MWTPEDSLLAQALIHIEDDTCSGCGQPLSVALSADSDPDGGTHRYRVDLPARCHSCTAIADAAEPYMDPQHAKHPHALRFAPQRVPRGTPPP